MVDCKMEWTTKQFIFIVGLHRSGTSLLHQILREHPLISGFKDTGVSEDEGQHLQTILPTGLEMGGPGRFGYHPEAYMDETHPLATPQTAAQLWEQWKPFWDITHPYLIEKSPPNILRTRFLQQLFPNSAFIAILRHPVAIAYATRKWSKTSIPSLLQHTLLCYEVFFKDVPFLNKVLILRYEEFVESPKLWITKILHWLDINSSEFWVRQEIRTDINKKYFQEWERDWNRRLIRWYWHLSGFTRQLKQLEKRAQQFGYQLKHPYQLLPLRLTETVR